MIGGSVFWVDPDRGVFIRHSIPIFHSGRRIYVYEKKRDCGELQSFETVPNLPYLFRPGVVPGMFACQGLSRGVETCIDHDNAQLRADGARDLDLQIVISNTVTIRPSSVRVAGHGYLLHCNAGQFGPRIYQNPFDQSGEVTATTPGVRFVNQNGRTLLASMPGPARPVVPVNPGRLNVIRR